MRKFKRGDILYNTLRTHPVVNYIIYSGKSYFNTRPEISGAQASSVPHIPVGHTSLYELNVDRISGSLVYPYIVKGGARVHMKNLTTSSFNANYEFGDIVSGSYPLSATIDKIHRPANSARPYVDALQHVLNRNKRLSPHFAYSSSFGDKSTQELGLVTIPAIFYGSTVKRGSVNLKFYITGTVVGEATDYGKQNGLLYETTGSSVGSVAGVVLYDEGFIILTGSWDISAGSHTEGYVAPGSPIAPKWVHWGQSISGSITAVNSAFELEFKGTHDIPTMTLLTNLPKGEMNFSSNPTYLSHSQSETPHTSSKDWAEPDNLKIKNIGKHSYSDVTSSFERIVYVSQVGIYDENRKLIGVAKLAQPLRKRECDEFTIKIKLDM